METSADAGDALAGRGRPQSLLGHPSPRYPEVTFCCPEAETRC
ncbi:MAG TPA: hypothetical protein VMI33_19235 [Streptosporangiaceae bacterium]|nr:hypothetical protein [Streptosporangiaceae bacterium]